MSTLKVHVLGSNSAQYFNGRYPSAQYLDLGSGSILLDCSEATLFRLTTYGLKYQKIKAICISHFHGDHFYGLMGLLTTMSLNKRKESMIILAPKGIQEYIELNLELSQSRFSFDLEILEIEDYIDKQAFRIDNIGIKPIELSHKIPSFGFLVDEIIDDIRFDKDKIKDLPLSRDHFIQIQKGVKEIEIEGQILRAEDVILPKETRKKYVYVTDTEYFEPIIPKIKAYQTLYHEATFLHELKHRAIETKHTTALEAATIALKAEVSTLYIGHFSSRYLNSDALLREARSVFPETYAVIEKLIIDL
ncbi:MAG: ribonuclease Z [Chitinophagales bacterium]|jgi:ribonuclease Z|nr:ribonuclease Z [Chitinophagales bacterium]